MHFEVVIRLLVDGDIMVEGKLSQESRETCLGELGVCGVNSQSNCRWALTVRLECKESIASVARLIEISDKIIKSS
jgi:hypothetical protein